jgi:hypothetical protein
MPNSFVAVYAVPNCPSFDKEVELRQHLYHHLLEKLENEHLADYKLTNFEFVERGDTWYINVKLERISYATNN